MVRYLVLIALVAPGCGAQSYPGAEADYAPAGRSPAFEQSGPETESMPAEPGQQDMPTEGDVARKIIYTADVDLVVDQFDPVQDRVEALVKQFGGFVANSNVSGSPGTPRSGQWKLRVPVERYEEFLAAVREAVRELGAEIQRVSVDSQDVTEEFYDVEARIRNKKKAEERLLDLLENATGELEDILTVERELSRVREEIERVEGRLRVLSDLTSLTTINLSVSERRDYVPEESPSYRTRVSRSFSGSVDLLVATAQGLSIAIVVLSPWLAVLLVFVLVAAFVWRMVRKRRPPSTLVNAEAVEDPPPVG